MRPSTGRNNKGILRPSTTGRGGGTQDGVARPRTSFGRDNNMLLPQTFNRGRPNTSLSGRPPPTFAPSKGVQRSGTSHSIRPTSARNIAGTSIGVQEPIHVPRSRSPTPVPKAKRPITAGLANVSDEINAGDGRTTTGSSIRSNKRLPYSGGSHDVSYFASMVHTKQREIEHEMGRLEKEIDRLVDDMATHQREEEQRRLLHDEVKQLEWEWTDFRKAIEKLNEQVPVDDIIVRVDEIKRSNAESATSIDELFLQKNKLEHESNQIAKDSETFYNYADTMVKEEDPEQLSYYRKLRSKLRLLDEEFLTKQRAIQLLNDEIKELQSEASEHKIVQEHEKNKSDLKEAQIVRNKLHDEYKVVIEMNKIEDIKSFQRSKMREFQKTMAELDRDEEQYDEEIRVIKHAIEGLEEDLEFLIEFTESYDESVEGENVPRLEKDNVEQLETKLENMKEENRNLEKAIGKAESKIHILEQEMSSKLPSKDEFERLKETLESQSWQAKVSSETLAILQEELKERSCEWETLQNLENLTREQCSQIKEKIELMNADIVKYSDLSALQHDSEATKAYLSNILNTCRERTRNVEDEIEQLKEDLENKKSKLTLNREWCRMRHLEHKLSQQAKIIHALQMDVSTRTRRTEYENDKARCLDMVHKLNTQCSGQ